MRYSSIAGFVVAFRDLSGWFARREGMSEVKPRHRAKAFFVIVDFFVLGVFGAYFLSEMNESRRWSDSEFLIVLQVVASFLAAFLLVYLFGRIGNLFLHCLVGSALIVAFAWFFYVLPYLNCG